MAPARGGPGGTRSLRPWQQDAAGVVALSLLARLVHGPGAIGYDASWALAWGDGVGRGQLPAFEAPFAPTPHPLTNALAVGLAPLGDTGVTLTLGLSFLSLGALTWFAFRFGARLIAPAVGAVLAAILFTRPTLMLETAQALVDIPFLAFVLAAGAVWAASPERRLLIAGLLALAGLLRPEGWALAALYAVWAWRDTPGSDRARLVGIAAAGPVLWALMDVVVTGNPLHSLHGTQALAAELDRPRGLARAVDAIPAYLRANLGTAIAFGGLAGAGLSLARFYERTIVPGAVFALGLLGFLVLGAAGLPVLTRYLLVPTVVLACFYAVGVAGWAALPRGERLWSAAVALGAVLAMGGLLAVPGTVEDLRESRDLIDRRREVQRDLRTLARSRAGAGAAQACSRIAVPEYQAVPLLALYLGVDVRRIEVHAEAALPDTAYFAYTSADIGRLLSIVRRPPVEPPTGAEDTLRARNVSWALYADC